MSKRKILVISICIVAAAGVLMLLRTPSVTAWMAERMVEKGMSGQIRQLRNGGELSVASGQLDSVWHNEVRYVMIIPRNPAAESGLKLKEILNSGSSVYSPKNLLGAYCLGDENARLLCEEAGLLVLPQQGFGLTDLRPDNRIGIYSIRRDEVLKNQSGAYYLLKLKSEF